MPHPEREHELQIALATALRELAGAKDRAEAWHNKCDAAESQRDALRAALQKHGCHEVECGANKEEDDQFCTCGLTAALVGGGERG